MKDQLIVQLEKHSRLPDAGSSHLIGVSVKSDRNSARRGRLVHFDSRTLATLLSLSLVVGCSMHNRGDGKPPLPADPSCTIEKVQSLDLNHPAWVLTAKVYSFHKKAKLTYKWKVPAPHSGELEGTGKSVMFRPADLRFHGGTDVLLTVSAGQISAECDVLVDW